MNIFLLNLLAGLAKIIIISALQISTGLLINLKDFEYPENAIT